MSRRRELIGWTDLERRIEEGHPFTEPVPGAPAAEFKYEPATSHLSLSIEHASRKLPSVEPVELTLNVETAAGQTPRLRVGTRDRHLHRYFYDFASEIIDRTRSANLDAAAAISDVWGAWVQLLDRDAIPSREKHVGLLGEPWLVARLSALRGWATTLDQWYTTGDAEHDFALEQLDIEVKSTISEARSHVISSPSQLEPSAG